MAGKEKGSETDTIVAISTPVGVGGIGIVRFSGAGAFDIGQKVFRPRRRGEGEYPRSHRLYYGFVTDREGDILDEVMVSFMRAPTTYTKEDIVEINCHSGIVSLRAILNRVLEEGARLAEPGEFTRRAYLNGRIDLSQAESVLNLINARSEKALKHAAKFIKGDLSPEIRGLRDRIMDLIMHVEASIDFPEEVEDIDSGYLKAELDAVEEKVRGLYVSAERGTVFQEGLKVSIVGKPNVGKSSLLNTLIQKQRAIVTEIPGTTRDILQEQLNIKGIPISLIDTAGIRKTRDPVEKMGVIRSREAIATADLVLLMMDASSGIGNEDLDIINIIKEEKKRYIVIVNKIDLGKVITNEAITNCLPEAKIIELSLKNKEGLDGLEESIASVVEEGHISSGESLMILNLRHKQALAEALDLFVEMGTDSKHKPLEVIAEELKGIEEKLGEITGETVSDDLLEKIFSNFCIGK